MFNIATLLAVFILGQKLDVETVHFGLCSCAECRLAATV